MKISELIMVVEDNEDLLINLEMMLEINGFEVLKATNGEQAINFINSLDIIPLVIISDIMMPIMNGYDFFKNLSRDPKFNRIPFIFLSAKSSPEDIRLGKLLGVDDYLTKPFNEKDLIATIKGKIAKLKLSDQITNSFSYKNPPKVVMNYLHEEMSKGNSSYKNAIVFLVKWDEVQGPKLISSFSQNVDGINFDITDIGVQLFQASVSIFGYEDVLEEEGILLKIKNINKLGYILFNAYVDNKVRGGFRQYMLGIINEEIGYIESLIIKRIFISQSKEYSYNKKLILEEIMIQIHDEIHKIHNDSDFFK